MTVPPRPSNAFRPPGGKPDEPETKKPNGADPDSHLDQNAQMPTSAKVERLVEQYRRAEVNSRKLREALGRMSAWDGRLRFNTFKRRYEYRICRELTIDELGDKIIDDHFPPNRPVKDHDPWEYLSDGVVEDTMDMLQEIFAGASAGMTRQALTWICRRNRYNPAQLRLKALPAWDGVDYIGQTFIRYFAAELLEAGVPRDHRVAYLERIGHAFFVGMVARIFEPGCKLDTMVVLLSEMKQGPGKSRGLKALMLEEDWFTDSIPTSNISPDTRLSMAGKVLVEFAEMPFQRSNRIEVIKAFLSSAIDTIRVPYGYLPEDMRRTCVPVGTANVLEFADVTGNRRFWPVAVKGQVDVDGIIQDREQMWAQALYCYRRGDQWWLEDSLEILAAEEQGRYLQQDVIEEYFDEFIAPPGGEGPQSWGYRPFLMKDLVSWMADKGYRRRDLLSKQDQGRFAERLKLNGFYQKNAETGRGNSYNATAGEQKRGKWWYPPDWDKPKT